MLRNVELSPALDALMTGTGEERVGEDWEVGEWLSSRYRVESKLGEGGMGVVLRCWDAWREQSVAMKLLHRWFSEHSLEQLRRELRVQEGLHHEGIAKTFDLGRMSSGQWYFTMEVVEWPSLEEELQEARQRGAAPLMSVGGLMGWLRGLCSVLSYAHGKGVIHRDLKPSNILSSGEGEVKLLDFGIAWSHREETSHSGAGTAYYMAPEQLEGESPTAAADVYAVGAMLYEILTGKVASGRLKGPWESLTRRGLEPSFPEAVDEVVLRALEPVVEDRFASVGELLEAMEAAVSEAFPEAPSEAVAELPGQASPGAVEWLEAAGEGFGLETSRGRYRFGGVLAEGEISTLYAGEDVVAKIADDPADNDLLRDELRVLQLLHSGKARQRKHLPVCVDSFLAQDGCMGLILERIQGVVELDVLREVYPEGVDQEHVVWILRRALSALGFAHSQGILHGNIEPAHLLVRPEDHNVYLIDWTCAIVHPARTGQGFKCYNELYSPPEVLERKPPLPASDLYSLGKTMIYLLGGDVESGQMPDAVDPRLQRFLQFFTRSSPLQRAQDAWKLFHQLGRLRKSIFGKHRFLELRVDLR